MLGRLTVGLLFFLLVWGNLVAGLKAGLACPDWPLCHGKILPPFRIDIFMEFLHRVIAAVAAGFLAALSLRRFRDYRGSARAVPLLAGLVVFLLAVYMASFDGILEPPVFSLSGRSALFFGVGALVFLL